MTRIAAFAIAAGTLFAAVPAHAQYGALAYDPDSRVWGRSYNQPSPRDADGVALSYCRSPGCRVVARTGPGQCGAIAAPSYGNGFRWATRPSRGAAEYAAVAGCQEQQGQYCHVVFAVCNE